MNVVRGVSKALKCEWKYLLFIGKASLRIGDIASLGSVNQVKGY